METDSGAGFEQPRAGLSEDARVHVVDGGKLAALLSQAVGRPVGVPCSVAGEPRALVLHTLQEQPAAPGTALQPVDGAGAPVCLPVGSGRASPWGPTR